MPGHGSDGADLVTSAHALDGAGLVTSGQGSDGAGLIMSGHGSGDARLITPGRGGVAIETAKIPSRAGQDWETWRFAPDKSLSRWYPAGRWTVTATAKGAGGTTVTGYAPFWLKRETRFGAVQAVRKGTEVQVDGVLKRVDPRGVVDYAPFAGQPVEILHRETAQAAWTHGGHRHERRPGEVQPERAGPPGRGVADPLRGNGPLRRPSGQDPPDLAERELNRRPGRIRAGHSAVGPVRASHAPAGHARSPLSSGHPMCRAGGHPVRRGDDRRLRKQFGIPLGQGVHRRGEQQGHPLGRGDDQPRRGPVAAGRHECPGQQPVAPGQPPPGALVRLAGARPQAAHQGPRRTAAPARPPRR